MKDVDKYTTLHASNLSITQVAEQYKKTARVVQSMDAFPKINEDYTQYTNLGAVVTILCALLCSALFISEVVRAPLLGWGETQRDAHRRTDGPYDSFVERVSSLRGQVWHRTTSLKSVLSVDTKPLPTDHGANDKMNIYVVRYLWNTSLLLSGIQQRVPATRG
jgi:hypothetical protein